MECLEAALTASMCHRAMDALELQHCEMGKAIHLAIWSLLEATARWEKQYTCVLHGWQGAFTHGPVKYGSR